MASIKYTYSYEEHFKLLIHKNYCSEIEIKDFKKEPYQNSSVAVDEDTKRKIKPGKGFYVLAVFMLIVGLLLTAFWYIKYFIRIYRR